MRIPRFIPGLVAAMSALGCITRAGGNLPPIHPEPAPVRPAIEQTVGDIAYTLDGGKMVTSNKAGRILNDEILKRWVERGYITSTQHVPQSEFTGSADFNLTLSGTQHGRSSIPLQVLSGLTLYIIPHTVDMKYDIQYVIENVRTGERYSAAVEDGYLMIGELLLLFALPIADRGASTTMDALADHLYEQLRSKGAFDAARSPEEITEASPPGQ